MSLLRSKSTRVLYASGGTLVDKTEQCRTWGTPNFDVTFLAADAIYIGRAHKFTNLYCALSTANSNAGVLSVSYWGGAAWEPFTDLLDETAGLSASGFIQWEEKEEWKKDKPANIAGLNAFASTQELFWVKVTISANTSAMSIRAIKRLLSDDRLLTTIHPEVMQYLPDGQTDYLPQHEFAKDLIVADLISKGLISYEDQIHNPDDYLLAASYKTIEVILAPIPGDDRLKLVKENMGKMYMATINNNGASLDKDKSEVVEEDEQEPGSIKYLGR